MLFLLTVSALAAASTALAAPSVIPPTSQSAAPSRRLHRRQVPFPFNPLTIGLGAVGVHDNKKNTNNIQTLQAQVQSTQVRLNQLESQEQALQGGNMGGPQLVRRQIGTILGGVGIHDSNKNRKVMQNLQAQCDQMRSQTDALLQSEGLAPGLQRRQLGIILDPIAIHKAHTDQKSISSIQAELAGINNDLDRIQSAQQVRMAQGSMPTTVNVITSNTYGANGGYNANVDSANESNYGAPSYGGGGALPSSQGQGYGGALPSNQGYGAPQTAY